MDPASEAFLDEFDLRDIHAQEVVAAFLAAPSTGVVRSRPPAAVRLPREVVERLVEYAMDMLWSTDQDARMAPSYDGGCCPICCTPCSALKLLLDTDRLDELAVRGKGSSWWSTTENGVDRGFLEHAWRKTSCHASEGWQLDDES